MQPGVSMFSYELEAKRLGLLHDMVPKAAAAGVLLNPNNASSENQLRQLQDAGRSLGLQLLVRRASSEREIDAAIESLVEAGARALIAGADPFFSNQRERLVAVAARHRLPAISALRLSPATDVLGFAMPPGSQFPNRRVPSLPAWAKEVIE